MKIIFLTTDITQVGGVERVISKLGNHFVNKYNYDIEIISVYKKQNNSVYFDLNNKIKIKYLNLESNNSSMSRLRRVINQFKLISEVKKCVKSEEFDIMITFNTMLGVAAALNRKSINGKIIASEHGDYYYFGKVWRMARKKLYRRLDKVVVLTNKDKSLYDSFLENVVVIPNPLTFETEEKSNLEVKKILSVGRLEDEKGFETIINIFNKIQKKHNGWSLEIVGNGSQSSSLKKQIELLELNDKIIISNFTKDIKLKYLNSSIFTLTSKTEAFGLVIAEAMECGVPCISYNTTGPAEIIRNNVDGILVEKNNAEMFEKELLYLIEDLNVRKYMGDTAKQNIQRYAIENIGVLWRDIFDEIKRN